MKHDVTKSSLVMIRTEERAWQEVSLDTRSNVRGWLCVGGKSGPVIDATPSAPSLAVPGTTYGTLPLDWDLTLAIEKRLSDLKRAVVTVPATRPPSRAHTGADRSRCGRSCGRGVAARLRRGAA